MASSYYERCLRTLNLVVEGAKCFWLMRPGSCKQSPHDDDHSDDYDHHQEH